MLFHNDCHLSLVSWGAARDRCNFNFKKNKCVPINFQKTLRPASGRQMKWHINSLNKRYCRHWSMAKHYICIFFVKCVRTLLRIEHSGLRWSLCIWQVLLSSPKARELIFVYRFPFWHRILKGFPSDLMLTEFDVISFYDRLSVVLVLGSEIFCCFTWGSYIYRLPPKFSFV